MERFNIKQHEWDAMSETEEGQYAQAELIEFVVSKAQMLAWEQYLQREEWEANRRKHT